jgi:hypothetical protein
MNKLLDELSIVPGATYVVLVVILCAACGMTVWMNANNPSGLQSLGVPLFLLIVLSIISIYVLLIGYINADAKRRGMRYVVWTLLAIFIPNALGIILYFLMRSPLPIVCAVCGTMCTPQLAFCPTCGTELRKSCPNCKRVVEPKWTICGWCGHKLDGAPAQAEPAPQ